MPFVLLYYTWGSLVSIFFCLLFFPSGVILFAPSMAFMYLDLHTSHCTTQKAIVNIEFHSPPITPVPMFFSQLQIDP